MRTERPAAPAATVAALKNGDAHGIPGHGGTVSVAPITDADIPAVAGFLHTYLNRRIPLPVWSQVMSAQWEAWAPNHGFMLRAGERTVGAYVAYYSQRLVAGRPERFCNLASWAVHPDYRLHSVRLLQALLKQDDYHFTDLSPCPQVESVNARLRFRYLDTSIAVLAPLPWPALPRRTVISADAGTITQTLSGDQLRLHADHAQARATHHLVIIRGRQSCYVMFRKRWYRGKPLFGSILYVSNQALFRRCAPVLARHLLARYGLLATFAELRITGTRPRASFMLPQPGPAAGRKHRWAPRSYGERYRGMFTPKMYRSATLEPDQIDDLYSELACVPGF